MIWKELKLITYFLMKKISIKKLVIWKHFALLYDMKSHDKKCQVITSLRKCVMK